MKGTASVPAELRGARRFPGYWRIENGALPMAPATSKGEPVVVFTGSTGPRGQAPPARTVTVEIAGQAASPPYVVVGPGSVVEIKNLDRVAHTLSIPGQESVMATERLAPGALRRQKFNAAGAYEIRCADFPHLGIGVLVVDSPYFAVTEAGGAFKIPEIPDGRATVKLFFGGRYVHEETVQITPNLDLTLKVPARPRDAGRADKGGG